MAIRNFVVGLGVDHNNDLSNDEMNIHFPLLFISMKYEIIGVHVHCQC